MFPLCDILGQAKLVYSEIKQISGCWNWRGITAEGHKGTSFWGDKSVVYLDCIGHIDVYKLYT